MFGDCFGTGKPLRYLCQDEMRIGLMSQRGRVITSRGVKPIAVEQYVRENFWVYGVVEPLSGWHLCQEYPHLNGTHFQHFITAVSDALGDEIAVMQMDQAQAHRAKALIWPENLIPVFQPPYSPELNPAERFWQHLKSPLKGKCFETL
uniref:IS630 family transposase n=1 Tax=Halomicronema sp. CCY15110 TaxID=2767773 RepID=UPI001951E721